MTFFQCIHDCVIVEVFYFCSRRTGKIQWLGPELPGVFCFFKLRTAMVNSSIIIGWSRASWSSRDSFTLVLFCKVNLTLSSVVYKFLIKLILFLHYFGWLNFLFVHQFRFYASPYSCSSVSPGRNNIYYSFLHAVPSYFYI